MSVACEVSQKTAADSPIGIFERYLTLWVGLCIIAGIALGHLLPGVFNRLLKNPANSMQMV